MYIIQSNHSSIYGSSYYNRDSREDAVDLATQLLRGGEAEKVVLFEAVQEFSLAAQPISTKDLK